MKPRALLLLCAFLAAPALVGQEVDRQTELEAIRDQIMVLQSQLNRVRREASGMRGELEQTEVALELQQTRLAEARTAREMAETALLAVEQEIADLEVSLEELRNTLRQRLIDLHRLGQEGYLRLFLSIRSEDDLLPGIRQVRYLVRTDAELLSRYETAHTELDFKHEELARQSATVEEWLAKEAERADQLERLKRRLASILRELEKEDRDLSSQTAQLVDKERKLANLLDFLYGRAGAPLSGKPVQEFRGVLDWPASGKVLRGFGTRLDPRYGTRIPHNGIDLATREGQPVRCVFPGKVLFAAPFQGHGLTVVVHHPGRVFSLYAGLKRMQVGKGNMLSLGQVLGESSDHLYFEIREENRPVDPIEWLR